MQRKSKFNELIASGFLIVFSAQLYEVCQALILHELGGLVQQPMNYNISDVYAKSSETVPVIFIHPSPPGTCYIWNVLLKICN